MYILSVKKDRLALACQLECNGERLKMPVPGEVMSRLGSIKDLDPNDI